MVAVSGKKAWSRIIRRAEVRIQVSTKVANLFGEKVRIIQQNVTSRILLFLLIILFAVPSLSETIW